MSNNEPLVYILDSNVFIEAYRRYYAFDLCPGFWDFLLHQNENKKLFSLDRVKKELEKDEDKITEWIEDKVSEKFFTSTECNEIIQEYHKVINHVNKYSQFYDLAKSEFASGADAWLIAQAIVNNNIIVTEEKLIKDSKRRVPIPNICRDFNVKLYRYF